MRACEGNIRARAHRRDVAAKAAEMAEILREDQLRRPTAIQFAYAAAVTSETTIIETLNTQIDQLGTVVAAHFGQNPDAEIYASQPHLGMVIAARVLGEFGDDPHRYTDAKAWKNYAGTSLIARASDRKKVVLAGYVRNRRLADAPHPSPGTGTVQVTQTLGTELWAALWAPKGATKHTLTRGPKEEAIAWALAQPAQTT